MSDDNRLAHLLTYTTFHIGVYISLVTALIGAGIFNPVLGSSWLVRYTVGCVVLAGICGGIVGKSIPEHRSYDQYKNTAIGYFSLKPFPPLVWANLEHLFFWIGVLPLALAFIFGGSDWIG
ncbi:MAG: hypothetical protein AAFY20_16125 [Cyanobacteria bacterium J06639_14]